MNSESIDKKLLPKPLRPFKEISATLDIVRVEENGVHDTVSIDSVTFDGYIAQSNDNTDRNSDAQGTSNCRSEDETHKNNERAIGEFLLQQIMKHLGTGKWVNYIVLLYGYGQMHTL